MADELQHRRLTPEEWAWTRATWETADRPGFAWLERAVAEHLHVRISRAALGQMASSRGWKGLDVPEREVRPVDAPQSDPQLVRAILLTRQLHEALLDLAGWPISSKVRR